MNRNKLINKLIVTAAGVAALVLSTGMAVAIASSGGAAHPAPATTRHTGTNDQAPETGIGEPASVTLSPPASDPAADRDDHGQGQDDPPGTEDRRGDGVNRGPGGDRGDTRDEPGDQPAVRTGEPTEDAGERHGRGRDDAPGDDRGGHEAGDLPGNEHGGD